MALTAVITDPSKVIPTQQLTITCQASDDELLLVDWLNTLVYEMATRKILFGRFEVHLKGHSLQATAWGESVDVTRHRPAVEVKGATYTALSLKQDERSHWIAQCVVDV